MASCRLAKPVYYALQTKGPNIGKPSIFVALAEKKGYAKKSLEDIVSDINKFDCQRVTFCGNVDGRQEQVRRLVEVDKMKHSYEMHTTALRLVTNFQNFFGTTVVSPAKDRIEKSILKEYVSWTDENQVFFNFDILEEKDIQFWMELIKTLQINAKYVYLQPKIKDTITATTMEVCRVHHYNFSPMMAGAD